MGIVRFALRFPHTFYVVAALILFLGVAAISSMPTDIFPEIRIPVVTVIWQYTELSTPEMEQRITTYSQYSISSNVNGIKDMEAQTLDGLSVQKIYFQPDVNLDLAIAQIVSATNSIRSLMPPGVQPPIVVQFNASSVPVLQISLSSDTLNEQQLYDYGIYRVRQQLAPIPGVTLPTPAGGKYRQIMVDIDPAKLAARGLTPLDVVNSVNTQNLTVPSGTAKIGSTQYTVLTNANTTNHRRSQRDAGQICQRRNRIPERRRSGARRIDGAAEHRTRGRTALGSAQRYQERQCVDARSRQCSQGCLADGARLRPSRPHDQRAIRSIDVREFIDRGCVARRCNRRGAHRADDPPVPRLMAIYAGRDDLNPARDPFVPCSALFPRRDAQHDDARRNSRWRSGFWSTTRLSPSKTRTACLPRNTTRCRRPRFMGRPA